MIVTEDETIHAEILMEHQEIPDSSHKEFYAILLILADKLKRGVPLNQIKREIRKSDINASLQDTMEELLNQQAEIISDERMIKLGMETLGAYTFLEVIKLRKDATKKHLMRYISTAREEIKAGKEIQDIIDRELRKYKDGMESFYRTQAKQAREIAYEKRDEKLSQKVRGWISVAVLDNRTSAQCVALHNQFYLKKDYEKRSNIPNPPPRHQNCYDKETKVMTDNGFKYLKDVSIGDKCISFNIDSKEMEYVSVVRTFKKYENKINYIKSKTIDMAVSENHPFIGFKRNWKDRKKYDFVKYEKIGDIRKSEFRLYVGAENEKENREYININGKMFKTSAFVRFMAIYLSDGHYSKKDNTVIISRSREQYKIKNILEELGLKVRANTNKLSILSKEIRDFCSLLGDKSSTKVMPKEIMMLGKEHSKDFINAYLISDGHISKSKAFGEYISKGEKSVFTTSEKLRDGLIIVAMNAGYSCSVREKEPKETTKKDGSKIHGNNKLYIIRLNSGKYRAFDYCTVENKQYNDYVYDVELEKNHTLLTMRNGRIVWGSNCRSILMTVWEGTRITDYKGQKLETFFKNNPKQAQGIMGKKKYRMWKSGKAKVKTYIDIKGRRFYRNDEIIQRLGIKSKKRLGKIDG